MTRIRSWRLARAVVVVSAVWVHGACATEPDARGNGSLTSSTPPTRRVHVAGSALVDDLGRQVVLRGFNAGGRAKMPPFLPFDVPPGSTVEHTADELFGALEGLGANAVRLTFSWEAFEPTRGAYDYDYLDRYEMLLDAAHAHGIAAIVDFHQDVFASPFCGDGFPLWAIGPIPHGAPHYDCAFPWWSLPAFNPWSTVNLAFHRLWTNTDGLADDMEAMWRTVAGALGPHPAVAAFEVINEPAPGMYAVEEFDSTVLPAFYERMIPAIRGASGGATVLWDERIGATGTPPDLVPPRVDGIVFAPHYYEPMIAIGFPFVLEDAIRADLASAFEPMERWNMPVLLGEFGVPNGNLAKAAYLDFVLDEVDSHRGHATMWSASMSPTLWNNEDFSVLRPDGTEQSWAGAVVRAYPRAVSGRIASFSWDADALRFELEVSDAGTDVSEIYLPRRHLGTAPSILVDGAAFEWDAARELLLVQAAAGASYTVVVAR